MTARLPGGEARKSNQQPAGATSGCPNPRCEDGLIHGRDGDGRDIADDCHDDSHGHGRALEVRYYDAKGGNQ